jgi:hypothetical protein
VVEERPKCCFVLARYPGRDQFVKRLYDIR